jgi:predicted permease
MSMRRQFAKLRSIFAARKPADDLGEEIRAHLNMEEQENLELGMSPEEARYAALRRFGNVTLAQERSNEMWTWSSLETLRQDIQYGLRQIKRAPAFALVVVVTLALGIGANSAIFSVVNAVVLHALPYPQPDRLVFAGLVNPDNPAQRSPYGAADYLAAHDRQRSFASFAAVAEGENVFTYTGGVEPLKVRGTPATAEFFSVLGVSPVLGRAFATGEDTPGRPHEVVLSHAFWEQHFGSDPQAIGRSMILDGGSYTIVGVMPPDFHFGWHNNDKLWPLLQIAPRNFRFPYWILPIGRLKPGISEAQAAADLSAVARDVQRQFPGGNTSAASIAPLKSKVVGDSRTPLLMLWAAVGLVLLIAVVNVANLQVAGITARDRELSVRAALGASRGRIARQVLTESLLLAALGGVLGVLLAYAGVQALLALAPAELPRLKEIAVNGRVLVFAAGITVLAGLLSGLAPLLRGFGRSLDESLRGGAQNLGEQRRRRTLRQALVVVEVSLSLVLLIGSGLLLRSFERLSNTSPGFNPRPLLSTDIALPEARYKDGKQIVAFYERLLDRVQNLPGVAAAGLTMSLPPNLLNMRNPFWVPSQPVTPGANLPLAVETSISTGYFRTLNVPLLRGRFFEDSDRTRNDEILIINETMARRYFPGQDPMGQRIKTGDPNPKNPWETIVGVVADVKYAGLDGAPEPTLYVPYFEDYWPDFSREMFLVVRADGDPRSVAASVRGTIRGLDGDLPAEMQTLNGLLSDSVAQPRFRTLLLGVFAGLALLLAAVGIFGVMAYVVSRRTQEIGVRMALGATRTSVLGMVLGEGLQVVLIGVAIGLVEALGLSRLIKSLLFGVQAADPLTFAAVPLVMIAVALAACYVPARRATRVDPLVALRCE